MDRERRDEDEVGEDEDDTDVADAVTMATPADDVDEAATIASQPEDEAVATERGGRPGPGAIGCADVPAEIGSYRVKEVIGSGGMGVVLAAYDPALERDVAIKLLKSQSRHSRAKGQLRLLREAQAMARLAHPNVVAVHEVGFLGDQVFVAMEYVEGVNLGEWLAAERREWGEVVEVFVAAGAGLAAAHAAGLVHRDFKPDNVLVGDDGRVRVGDFGIVGIDGHEYEGEGGSGSAGTGGSAMTATLTRAGALLGTPLYMAPEQQRGADADARADQFSFCISLYEALYGRRPFAASSFAELRDLVAAGAPSARPDRDVPMWLHKVVMRGLEPDRERRFSAMADLLVELGGRRQRQRRHRLVAGAVAMAGLAVAAAAYLTIAGGAGDNPRCRGAEARLVGVWDRSVAERLRAGFAATQLGYADASFEPVAAILDDYAAAWVVAHTEVCTATHIDRKQSQADLDLRMACLERRARELAVLVEVLGEDVDAQLLGRAAAAANHLPSLAGCADLVALAAAIPPPEDAQVRRQVELVRGQLQRVAALERAGRYQQAQELATAAAAAASGVDYPPLVAELLYLRGSLAGALGDTDAAASLLAQAARVAAVARDDRLTAEIQLALLWTAGYQQSRFDAALALEVSAAAAVARAGNSAELRGKLLSHVGTVLMRKGDLDGARAKHAAAIAVWEEGLGPDHPDLATALNNIGNIARIEGKYAEAMDYSARALPILERSLGSKHPRVASAIDNLGMTAYRLGDYAAAAAHHRRALAIVEGVGSGSTPQAATILNNLANAVYYLGETETAEELYRRALAIRERLLGDRHPDVAMSLGALGSTLALRGELDEGRRLLERGLAIREQVLGADHADVAFSAQNLGEVMQRQGDCPSALVQYARALAIWERAHGKDYPLLAYPLSAQGRCLLASGKAAAALAPLERALAIHALHQGEPGERAATEFALAQALWRLRRERGRAVGLAGRARAGYRSLAGSQAELGEVEAWMKQHRVK